MPYATVFNVAELNAGRTIGATTPISATQVVDWLGQTAGEIDGILRARGYITPVPTTATSAFQLVLGGNALGAHARVEHSAQVSDRRDTASKMWSDFLAMLRTVDLQLDDGTDPTKTVRFAPDPARTPFFAASQVW